MITIAYKGYTIALFPPEEPFSGVIVYTHMEKEPAAETVALLPNKNAALAAIGGVDWERELSPWPAGRAFRGGADFAGNAGEYCRVLTGALLPGVEEELGIKPECRAIVGYSLAGLFALFALYQTQGFERAASVSGSLWYDGFIPYLENTPFGKMPERIYLSVGDKESNGKNPRMSRVGECTRQAAARFEALGIETKYEQNPGGHFSAVQQRMAKGIAFLIR